MRIAIKPKAGVYAITCTENLRKYFGSSSNLRNRWLVHKSALRHGKNENPLLQKDWDIYGETAFKFEVVSLESDIATRQAKEQNLILSMPLSNLYNLVTSTSRERASARKSKWCNRKAELKVTIYFQESQIAFVEKQAARRNVPRSRIIQEAVQLMMKESTE